MHITDKVNTLVMLSGMTNVRIARALNVDASLISRWRNGERIPNPEYFYSLASFFASVATNNYQKLAIATLIDLEADTEILTKEFLTNAIEQWLMEDEESNRALTQFFNTFTTKSEQNLGDIQKPLNSDKRFFCGHAGLREALLVFVQILLKNNYHGDILLFTDKAITWLIENPPVFQGIISLVKQLGTNCRILVVHPSTNQNSDIFNLLDALLPLFRTANIQPYYCPTFKSTVFHQFICIAPGVSAIVSQGIGDCNTAPVALYTDKKMVRFLTTDFKQLLGISKPLFQFFGPSDSEQIIKDTIMWHKKNGDIYSKGNALPQISMPPDLMEKTIDRTHSSISQKALMKREALSRNHSFIQHIQNNQNYIILTLPDIEKIKSGKIPVCHSRVYYNEELFYSCSDYHHHLTYLLELMERYPNLHICLTNQCWPDIFVIAVHGEGAIIHKTKQPTMTLSSTNEELAKLIYFYMEHEYEKLSLLERDRSATIYHLRSVINELQPVCNYEKNNIELVANYYN